MRWEGSRFPSLFNNPEITRRREPRDFGQTNPISRPEAEWQIAGFCPNEPNFRPGPERRKELSGWTLLPDASSKPPRRTNPILGWGGFWVGVGRDDSGGRGSRRADAGRGARREPRPPRKAAGRSPPRDRRSPDRHPAQRPLEGRADQEIGVPGGFIGRSLKPDGSVRTNPIPTASPSVATSWSIRFYVRKPRSPAAPRRFNQGESVLELHHGLNVGVANPNSWP